MYKIISIQIKQNQATLVLDNDMTRMKIQLLKSFIEKYHLRVNQYLTHEQIEYYQELEKVRDCYNQALKFLSYRDYSQAKLKEKLINKEQWSLSLIEEVLNILESRNFVNDYDYTLNYITQYLKKGYGIEKASYNLLKEGVPQTIIDDCLQDFTIEDQKEEVMKIIQQMIASNKKYPASILKDKIRRKLYYRGFTDHIIEQCLNQISIEIPEDSVQEMLQIEFNKVYNRYSRKYTGKELHLRLINFLKGKGFKSQDIRNLIDSLGSENNEN